MKRYLLDTALLAAYLHKRAKAITFLTPLLQSREAATSMIVYGEVVEYLKGLPDFSDHYRKFHLLLEEIPAYPLTYPVLERFADLRRNMRPPYGQGLIGDMDTLIAATALENHLTLLTQEIGRASCRERV